MWSFALHWHPTACMSCYLSMMSCYLSMCWDSCLSSKASQHYCWFGSVSQKRVFWWLLGFYRRYVLSVTQSTMPKRWRELMMWISWQAGTVCCTEFLQIFEKKFQEFFTNFTGSLCGLYARFRQLDATVTVYILMTACYHIALNAMLYNYISDMPQRKR